MKDLRREVGGYIHQLAKVGALDQIAGIAELVEQYEQTSTASNGESKWWNEDNAKRSLFDSVIGYRVFDETWSPGTISRVAPHLPSFPNNDAEDHLRVTAHSIECACEKIVAIARQFSSRKPDENVDLPLSNRSIALLFAMWGLRADINNPTPARLIFEEAHVPYQAHAFDQLKAQKLVKSARGLGYFYTKRGEERAEALGKKPN